MLPELVCGAPNRSLKVTSLVNIGWSTLTCNQNVFRVMGVTRTVEMDGLKVMFRKLVFRLYLPHVINKHLQRLNVTVKRVPYVCEIVTHTP